MNDISCTIEMILEYFLQLTDISLFNVCAIYRDKFLFFVAQGFNHRRQSNSREYRENSKYRKRKEGKNRDKIAEAKRTT